MHVVCFVYVQIQLKLNNGKWFEKSIYMRNMRIDLKSLPKSKTWTSNANKAEKNLKQTQFYIQTQWLLLLVCDVDDGWKECVQETLLSLLMLF